MRIGGQTFLLENGFGPFSSNFEPTPQQYGVANT
jgi:hypothetical protein